MKKILVIMSTYNGHKYLREQLDSIFAQKDVDIRLLVRDDGSSDDTINILEEYGAHKNIQIIRGTNVGPCKSFIDAIFAADDADFYAFSDQDDVWLPEKLLKALSYISYQQGPALYHSNAAMVDKDLKPMANIVFDHLETFGGALLTSATGCTMVMNKSLMDIVKTYYPNIKKVVMHDAWVYRIAYAIGAYVYYDKNSYICYRQHENNVATGTSYTFKKKIEKLFIKEVNIRQTTVDEILIGFRKYMNTSNIMIAESLAYYKRSFFNRVRLLLNRDIRTNYLKTNIQIKVLIILGKL